MEVNKNKINISIIPLLLLYISCIAKVMSFSNSFIVIGILLFIVSILVLFIYRSMKLTYIFNFEFLLICVYIVGSFYVGFQPNPFLILVTIFFLNMVFKISNISGIEFIKFVNYTFLIFTIISLLVYFKILNINRAFNSFDVNIFGRIIETFVGIGGSTSQIDTYSGIVLLINLLLNNKKSRWCWILISGITMLMTFRYTPIISLVLVLIFYYIICKCKINSSKLSKRIFAILGIVSIFSFYMPKYITFINFTNITHARNVIWNMYIDIINTYSMKEFLLGLRYIPETYVSWSYLANTNPHSSFLTYFIYYGFITYIFYYIYMVRRTTKTNNNKYLSIVLFILISSITNGAIFTLDNPIYLIILYYIMNSKDRVI